MKLPHWVDRGPSTSPRISPRLAKYEACLRLQRYVGITFYRLEEKEEEEEKEKEKETREERNTYTIHSLHSMPKIANDSL